MATELAARETDELDAAIESITALSGSTTPTNYEIDLSILSRPPYGSAPKNSHGSPKNRMRKPSRASSQSSLPLPSSPPHEVIDSDDIDGPEDFTMNMEYWMRCKLSDVDKDGAVDREEDDHGSEDSMDPTIERSVHSWMSRGSERLKTMFAERSSGSLRQDAKSTLAPSGITELHEPKEAEMAEETALPEACNKETEAPVEGGDIGHEQQGPRSDRVLSAESSGSPSAVYYSPPPRPTVEDYFSTPARTDPFRALKEKAAEEYQEATSPSQLGSFSPKSDERSRSPVETDRVFRLEAELRALRAELQQARQELTHSRSRPSSVRSGPISSEAEAHEELQRSRRTIYDLTNQLMKRERNWLRRTQDADAEHALKQARLRETFEARLQALEAKLQNQSNSPIQDSPQSASSQHSPQNEASPADDSQVCPEGRTYLGATPDRLGTGNLQQVDEPRPLDSGRDYQPDTATEKAGTSLGSPQSSTERHLRSSGAESIKSASMPIAQSAETPTHSPPASSPDVDGPTSPLRHSNDPYFNHKLAQILGVPVLPSPSHLDRLVATRERKVLSLQQHLDDVTQERNHLRKALQNEQNRSVAEETKRHQALAMQKANSEARIKFLREEITQRAAEIADAKLLLLSAQRDADSMNARLRCTEESAREVTELKSSLAGSEATRDELQRQLVAVRAERDDALSHHRALEDRVRELEQQSRPELHADAHKRVEDARVRADNTINDLRRDLQAQQTRSSSLEQELAEARDELDLLREQFRISALDGADDRRDSGIGDESSGVGQSTMSMKGELENVRNELREQISVATQARGEARDAKRQVEALIITIKTMEEQLNLQRKQGEEVDRRVEDALLEREAVYLKKIKELKGEKKQLGRALMRSWGEKECGGEEVPQRYRYAF